MQGIQIQEFKFLGPDITIAVRESEAGYFVTVQCGDVDLWEVRSQRRTRRYWRRLDSVMQSIRSGGWNGPVLIHAGVGGNS